ERTLRREQHLRAVQLSALTKAMPTDVQMSTILRQLVASSAAAGVRINSIAPQPVIPGNGYGTVPLSVTVEGRYFGIMNFAHLLRMRTDVHGQKVRASGRLFSIPSMEFAGGGAGTGTSNTLV